MQEQAPFKPWKHLPYFPHLETCPKQYHSTSKWLKSGLPTYGDLSQDLHRHIPISGKSLHRPRVEAQDQGNPCASTLGPVLTHASPKGLGQYESCHGDAGRCRSQEVLGALHFLSGTHTDPGLQVKHRSQCGGTGHWGSWGPVPPYVSELSSVPLSAAWTSAGPRMNMSQETQASEGHRETPEQGKHVAHLSYVGPLPNAG